MSRTIPVDLPSESETAYPVLPEKPSENPERNEMYVDWEAGVVRIFTPEGEWAELNIHFPERGE